MIKRKIINGNICIAQTNFYVYRDEQRYKNEYCFTQTLKTTANIIPQDALAEMIIWLFKNGYME